MEFVGAGDRRDNLLHKVWERLIAMAIQILENNRTDEIATSIPISGRLDDPEIGVGAAFREIFQDIISVRTVWRSVRYTAKGMLLRMLTGNARNHPAS